MPERQAGRSLLEPFRQDPAFQYLRHRAPKISASAGRILDTFVAVVVLVVALPLFLGAAIAVRRRKGGPILRTRSRVGAGGRLFQMFDFGPSDDGTSDDRSPTYEWVAALPQLLNVLRGDMSLIGPPPSRPEEPARALRVRPGVIHLPTDRGRRGRHVRSRLPGERRSRAGADAADDRRLRGMIPRL